MKRQLAELFNVRLKHPGVVHESWNSSAISGHVTNGLWPGKVSKQRELVALVVVVVAMDAAEGCSESASSRLKPLGLGLVLNGLSKILISFRHLLVITMYDSRRKVFSNIPAVSCGVKVRYVKWFVQLEGR